MAAESSCPQQLLLQTFALMTAWSHSACAALLGDADVACACPQCGAGAAAQRLQMAKRIVEQLQQLHSHPRLGDGLRQGLGELHGHWQQLLPRLQPIDAGAAALLH
jgi:hypothetical protein